MLLVRTKLALSQIHGIGLFADQLIPKGTEVWRFVPGFDIEKTDDEIAAYPSYILDWFKCYGYLDYHFGRYILCADDARFVNHSDNPNINQDYSLDFYGVNLAIHDIQRRDEITIDYRVIEKENWLSQPLEQEN
jgi:SET domain-containing protein